MLLQPAMPTVDDTALRAAASELLRAARLASPGVALAVHATEEEIGVIIIEIVFGPDGARSTAIVFDHSSYPEQKVLLSQAG